MVLPSFTQFSRLLPGFIAFFFINQVLLCYLMNGTRFLLKFFCRVFKSGSLSATVVELQTGFYWVFTGFYRALLGFTVFFLGLTGFDLV